jgi:hypothetical protein
MFLSTLLLFSFITILEANFCSIGDWGGANLNDFHSIDEYVVSNQLGKTAAQLNISFIINVGDNHYYSGTESTMDPLWKIDYEDVFTNPSLFVPWYSVLGNHDYGKNAQSQVDYISPKKNRWKMPARYYYHREHIGTNSEGGEEFTSIIFLDSSPCINFYRNINSNNIPISSKFYSNIMKESCNDQYNWLKTTLKRISKNDWFIVVSHHPLEQIDAIDFMSLLQNSTMSLYFAGHEHLLRNYQFEKYVKQYHIISGAGSFVSVENGRAEQEEKTNNNNISDINKINLLYEEIIAGFTAHVFINDFRTIVTSFVNYLGNIVYSFEVHK